MKCNTGLKSHAFRFSLACALFACLSLNSFAAIIVTPVLRSQVAGVGNAVVTVDIYGASSGPGATTQAVGAFGVTVSLTGAGPRTAFSVSEPASVFPGSGNSFRELVNNPTFATTNTGNPNATQTFTFTRSRMLPGGSIFPENVNIAAGALPATGAPVDANRLIGTIAFTVTSNGDYSFTTAAANVPNTVGGGSLGTGFLVQGGDGIYSAIAGNTFSTANLNITAVPEPSSIALMAVAGIGGLGMIRRMKRRSKVS